jgi:hypothetical protein
LGAAPGPSESFAQYLSRAAAFWIVVTAAEAAAILVWLGPNLRYWLVAAGGAITFGAGFLLFDWNWLKKATARARDVSGAEGTSPARLMRRAPMVAVYLVAVILVTVLPDGCRGLGAIAIGEMAGMALTGWVRAWKVRRWEARSQMDLLVADQGGWAAHFDYFVRQR